MSVSESRTVASVNAGLKFACAESQCFYHVIMLDLAKKGGHTLELASTSKREPHIWDEEEYQKALARIRDRAIMNGLTARAVNETFRAAHAEAAGVMCT